MDKPPIEIMTMNQVRTLSCNYPGCRASKEQMGYEILSDEKRIVSVFCPFGHKRSIVQIKMTGMMKRRDSIKVGKCETKRCKGSWISTAGNRRFCVSCQEERDRKSRAVWSERYSAKRRNFKSALVEVEV